MKKRIVLYGEMISVDTKTGEGLKKIYDILQPCIYGFANKYHIDGRDTQDKIQDLRIKLWVSIPKYNPEKSSFPTFTSMCFTNFIKDQLKYQSIRQEKIQFISLTNEILKKCEVDNATQ